jgi:hypothetical protein
MPIAQPPPDLDPTLAPPSGMLLSESEERSTGFDDLDTAAAPLAESESGAPQPRHAAWG